MARLVNREAMHFFTAKRSSVSPETFKKVSCWPAKLASGRSSAVAEERTATRRNFEFSPPGAPPAPPAGGDPPPGRPSLWLARQTPAEIFDFRLNVSCSESFL